MAADKMTRPNLKVDSTSIAVLVQVDRHSACWTTTRDRHQLLAQHVLRGQDLGSIRDAVAKCVANSLRQNKYQYPALVTETMHIATVPKRRCSSDVATGAILAKSALQG